MINMFPEQLKKILRLIKQTRDRVVIFDASTPDESFVVMDFDNYSKMATSEVTAADHQPAIEIKDPTSEKSPDLSEKIEPKSNLTEEDLTDKINREISVWKNDESSPYLAEEGKPRPGWKIPPQVKNKALEVKE